VTSHPESGYSQSITSRQCIFYLSSRESRQKPDRSIPWNFAQHRKFLLRQYILPRQKPDEAIHCIFYLLVVVDRSVTSPPESGYSQSITRSRQIDPLKFRPKSKVPTYGGNIYSTVPMETYCKVYVSRNRAILSLLRITSRQIDRLEFRPTSKVPTTYGGNIYSTQT
jgi:hypothetical protein